MFGLDSNLLSSCVAHALDPVTSNDSRLEVHLGRHGAGIRRERHIRIRCRHDRLVNASDSTVANLRVAIPFYEVAARDSTEKGACLPKKLHRAIHLLETAAPLAEQTRGACVNRIVMLIANSIRVIAVTINDSANNTAANHAGFRRKLLVKHGKQVCKKEVYAG
jgi:hypothetical protein